MNTDRSHRPARLVDLDLPSVKVRPEWAIQQSLETTVHSRRKTAPREIVEALHGRIKNADSFKIAEGCWKQIASGVADRPDQNGAAFVYSFAELCFRLGRLDILAAVHNAGVPDWVQQMPRRSPEDEQRFGSYPLVDAMSPGEWLDFLSTMPEGQQQEPKTTTLFVVATRRRLPQSRAFLEFALTVSPDHPAIAEMRQKTPEAAAAITELQMQRHICAQLEATTELGARRTAPRLSRAL